ncbi:MAG: hypothetical protein ACPGID_09245 [Rubricella sp.]
MEEQRARLDYLLFGAGLGLLIQPAIDMMNGRASEAAPFAAVGIGLWVFALVRIRRRGGAER